MQEKARKHAIKAVNSQMWMDFMHWVEDQQQINYDDMLTCSNDEMLVLKGKGKMLLRIATLRDEMNRGT